MREKGWLCRPQKKKWVCTTDSNHKLPVYPNLIKDLTLDGINQLWVPLWLGDSKSLLDKWRA